MSCSFFRVGTVVECDGRRYHCRPPSLLTVVKAETEYASEVVSLYLAHHPELARELKMPEVGEDELTRETALRVFVDGEKAADVLGTCVRLEGGKPGELGVRVRADKGLAIELAEAVLGLVDLDILVPELKLDEFLRDVKRKGSRPKSKGADVPSWDRAVAAVAKVYSADPFAVASDWPFLAFISAVKMIAEAGAETAQAAGAGKAQDISTGGLPGLGYVPPAMVN